jgi:hypothetical protein
MNWVSAAGATSPLLVDGVNLNDQLANQANIQTQLFQYNTAPAQFSNGAMCWTPLGRSYFVAGPTAANMFDGLLPTTIPIEIQVMRNSGGATYRSVLVPPNGMARLFSHTLPTHS